MKNRSAMVALATLIATIAPQVHAETSCPWSYAQASFGGEEFCLRENGMDRMFADDGETTDFIRYNPRHLGTMPFEIPAGILEIKFHDGALSVPDPSDNPRPGRFGGNNVRTFVPSELRFRGQPFYLSCRESLQPEFARVGGQTCSLRAAVTSTSHVVFSVETVYGRDPAAFPEVRDIKTFPRVEEGFEPGWQEDVRGLEGVVSVLLYKER